GMVSISTRVRRLEPLIGIAEAHANVFCSVGTHPHYAHEELDLPWQQLVRLAAHPKVVAIGEAGLDYFYDNSPPEAPATAFPPHTPAAPAVCRSSFMRAMPMPMLPPSWRRRWARAPSRRCCTALPGATSWLSAAWRSGSTSRSRAS